jgi:hypothetical protein
MFRTLYTLTVVALLGSTTWAAAGFADAPSHSPTGIGLVILTALQR